MASPDSRLLVAIKKEPLSTNKLQMKQPTLPTMPSINVKKDFGGRLASFQKPRDLTLSTAASHLDKLKTIVNPQSKKLFVPNVNVTRRKVQKSASEPKDNVTRNSSKTSVDAPRRNPRNKGNFIQTQGVFSEGSTGKPKQFKQRDDVDTRSRIEKPKLNLNRNTDKKKEESTLKDIMKDNFLDDKDIMPDLNDPPMSLPLLLNARNKICDDVDATFEALQIRNEKCDELPPPSKILKLFEDASSHQLLVFDFPPDIVHKETDKRDERKDKNKQQGASKSEQFSTDRMSRLGEGQWGSLKILANGNAYMAVGSEKIPVHMVRYSPKQTVMSVKLGENAASKGELINLGRVAGTFVCSSDLTLDDTKLK